MNDLSAVALIAHDPYFHISGDPAKKAAAIAMAEMIRHLIDEAEDNHGAIDEDSDDLIEALLSDFRYLTKEDHWQAILFYAVRKWPGDNLHRLQGNGCVESMADIILALADEAELSDTETVEILEDWDWSS